MIIRGALGEALQAMLSPAQIKFALIVCDIALAFAAPFLAWFSREFFVGLQGVKPEFYFYAFWSAISTLTLLRLSGASRVAWRFFSLPDAVEVLFSISLGVVLGAVGSFFFDRLDSVPRSLVFIHVFIQTSIYVGARLLLKRVVDANPSGRRKPTYVLLVGCNQISYVYARAVESVGNGSLRIIAALTHDPTMLGHRIRGFQIIALFNKIDEVIGHYKIRGIDISRLVIAAGQNEITKNELEGVFQVAQRHNLDVNDIHALFSEVAGPVGLDEDFNVDEITLRGPYWGVKRGLDIFGAVALLLLLSPFFALTSLLVQLDVGKPRLFWQERPGRHGKMIRVFKFRTMRDSVTPEGVPVPDELRVSKVGLILRKLRLDELPQLWNILVGDMSFIGPRPLLFVDQPEEVSQRLAVRPGISGWAQVNGGKLVSPEEKRALDLWYIAHVSFTLEMKIVYLTLLVMARGDIARPQAVREALEWLRAQEESLTPY